MFFSRKGRAGQTAEAPRPAPAATIAEAEDPRDIGEIDAEIEELSAANRREPDPEVTRRILALRHQAGLKLIDRPASDLAYPEPAFDRLPGGGGIAEVEAGEVTPELLRAAMLRDGSLLIRGLIPREEALHIAGEIDRAFEARQAREAGTGNGSAYFADFESDERFKLDIERSVVNGGGAGLLAADSPQVIHQVFEAFERAGLRRLAGDYLGERTAISVNKSLLRKVIPTLFKDAAEAAGTAGVRPSAWHQDGAFWNPDNGFVRDVRALNVWLSLSRCGDLAPGMDVVARRLDNIVPTGTEGATFNWSVSQAVAEESAGDAGIVRPIFEPGDALLFDELCLHSTAAEPDMPNPRYAVESWFFGGSGFPTKYAPLAF
jgi:hypothetical protein